MIPTPLRAAALRAVALVAVLAPASAEDLLVLEDGRIVRGPSMVQKEGYVELTYPSGTLQVPDAMVDVLLVEGEEITFEPQTEDEREKFEQGYVRFEGRWTRIRNAKREIEKRVREQVEDVVDALEHRYWRDAYEEESDHFRWKFNVPRFVARRYQEAADAYYEIFSDDWRVRRDKRKPKLSINFCNDAKQFHRASGAPGGALAYFMFLGDYDLWAYYERTDPDFTEQVLFHEIGHYLHKLIDEDFKYPHWPGESLCEYYGGARLDERGDLEVGLVHNGRLSSILRDIENGEQVDLRTMITTAGFEDYTWGWSFVHFLLESREYEKDFRRFFLGLATDRDVRRRRDGLGLKSVDGEEVLRYFMECMDLDDEEELRELEREWHAYIENELEFEGAAGLVWEAQTAKRLGERLRARRLYGEAMEAGEDAVPAKAHFDYARLLGGGRKALEQYEKAVEKAPLTANFRYAWGVALVNDGQEEEGARQKALAKELDPEIDIYVLDLEALQEEEDD